LDVATTPKKYTFTEGFSWTSYYRDSRTLFTPTEYWPFSAWDNYFRAELLVAIAATMLGNRVFETLGRKPCYPEPTACYPWGLDNAITAQDQCSRAHEASRRVATRDAAARNNRQQHDFSARFFAALILLVNGHILRVSGTKSTS
jgi:hypothetical protein